MSDLTTAGVKTAGKSSHSSIRTGDILELLAAIDAENLHYVSWKNNQELADALNGQSDLDIFVPLKVRSSFIRCAQRLRWIQLVNPVALHPWTGHFYNLDSDHMPHHIHVYFKLVTGESWIKEYVLPLENLMITGRTRDSLQNIWVLNDTNQAYFFAIRHLLKAGSLSSRFLYSKKIDSYRDEWHRCGRTIESLPNLGSIKLNNFAQGSGLTNYNFEKPTVWTAMKFRFSLSPLLRLPWWSLPARRVGSFYTRTMNKLIFDKKKLFINSGLILVIAGVDGSGKTTMLAEIDRVLSDFLTVRRYSLGRPQHRFLEMIARLVLRRTQLGKDQFKGNKTPKNQTLMSVIPSTVLSLLRLRMAKKALRTAMKGQLALVDRWPTDINGMMDGPRIGINTESAMMIRLCSRIEHWAYQRMPKADVCFFLDVPVDQLISRNRIRVKPNKESDAEILDRYNINAAVIPLTNRLIHFDNNGSFDQKRKELLSAIWNEIAGAC